MPPMTCEHLNFSANVDISRLASKEGGPITSYLAEVRIVCADCGLPFEFRGLPVGVNLQGAAVAVDALEARLAITPQGVEPSPLDLVRYTIHGLHS
jgi:hypothetical protein